MKLAFSTLGCPNYTIDEVIAIAQKNKYAGVSIRTVRGEAMLPDLDEFTPKGVLETHRKFKSAGLAVPCVMSGVRFTSPEKDERENQLKTAKAYIDIAEALESPFIRIFGGPIKPDMPYEETYTQIVDGFRMVGEYAAKRGITALLETHDTFSTGKESRDLLNTVDQPGIAIIWDFLHSCRFGETIEDSWNYLGGMIKDVHIKDSSEYSESGFDLKLPGEGKLPISAVLRLLINNGYDGWFTFEWEKGWHPEIEEPEVAIPAFMSYMNSVMGEL